MKQLLTLAFVLPLLLAQGCTSEPEPRTSRALGGTADPSTPVEPGYNVEQATVAVAPFRAAGAAESGQYGLALTDFSGIVAVELGAVSGWPIVESERLDTLEVEQRFSAAVVVPNDATPAEIQAAADGWAAEFPTADYVLLGQINGFDVQPVRAAGTLSRRQNRVRSNVTLRIADTRTREWTASRSVDIDELLDDDTNADTQIRRAMQRAAERVVSEVLLAVAREFRIWEIRDEAGGQVASVLGGTVHGVRTGQRFRAVGSSSTDLGAELEVISVFKDYSVARVVSGRVDTDFRVPATLIQSSASDVPAGPGPVRVAVGRFFDINDPDEKPIEDSLWYQIEDALLMRMSSHSGLRIVEGSDAQLGDLLNQQLLDDLSRGRDPSLPRGSLTGVDYLIFGTMGAFEVVAGERKTVTVFGRQFDRSSPSRALFEGTVYILDVNSGEYVTSDRVSAQFDLTDEPALRAPRVADDIAQRMFRSIMFGVRPLEVRLIADGRAVLNHQAPVGIAVGDRFTAMSRGQDVVDPNTGAVMRNMGGAELAELEVERIDAGGWPHARVVSGELPPVGSLLVVKPPVADAPPQPTRRQIPL